VDFLGTRRFPAEFQGSGQPRLRGGPGTLDSQPVCRIRDSVGVRSEELEPAGASEVAGVARGLRDRGSPECLPEEKLKLTSYPTRQYARGIHFQQQRGIVVNDVVRKRIGLKRLGEHQRIPAAV
jgi:hypothetical protein